MKSETESKYYQVNLQNMLEELGKDRVEAILSDFSCPLNEDVEYFLKRKAEGLMQLLKYVHTR